MEGDDSPIVSDERKDQPNIFMAFLVGLGAAALAGIIWYFFVTLTEWQFGFISILVGWLVGQGVVWGAGHKRGRPLQLISVVLTVAAIFLSEYLIFNHFFHEVGGMRNLTISEFFEVYGDYFTEGRGFMDVLFFGIAIWQAYVTPRER